MGTVGFRVGGPNARSMAPPRVRGKGTSGCDDAVVRQPRSVPEWVVWLLTALAVVLLAVGPVVQAVVPGDGEIRSAREQVVTCAWLATALAAGWLLTMFVGFGGRRRARKLASRFPESVVFGAVRTSEVLSAYHRLIAPGDPRRARLPHNYTVVVDSSGFAIWGGSSARSLVQLPADAVVRLSTSMLDVDGTKRPTIVVDLVGLPVASIPFSPIGAGLHGLGSLSPDLVSALSDEIADRIHRPSLNPTE